MLTECLTVLESIHNRLNWCLVGFSPRLFCLYQVKPHSHNTLYSGRPLHCVLKDLSVWEWRQETLVVSNIQPLFKGWNTHWCLKSGCCHLQCCSSYHISVHFKFKQGVLMCHAHIFTFHSFCKFAYVRMYQVIWEIISNWSMIRTWLLNMNSLLKVDSEVGTFVRHVWAVATDELGSLYCHSVWWSFRAKLI